MLWISPVGPSYLPPPVVYLRPATDSPLTTHEGGNIRKAYDVGKMFGLFAQERIVYGIGADGRIVYAQKGNPPTAEILAALGR